MPGGGVEYDESLVAAHSFTIPDGGRDGRPYKSVRIVFSALVVGGTLGTIEVDGSTHFAQWVPLNDVPALESRTDIVDVAYTAIRLRVT